MPTIKRNIIELIRTDEKAEMGKVCCDALKTAFREDYGARLSYGKLTFGGNSKELHYCPFCGEKVVYDDTIIPPEGYIRRKP